MRNGLNIAGVSEIVHEIREKPAEALIVFNTSCREVGSGVAVAVGTAHHGTFRMARDFRIGFTDVLAGETGLSAVEGAVAALGACVLITHVHGYSARGISITSLRVVVSASVRVDAAGRWAGGDHGLRDVGYRIEIDAEGSPDMLRQVTQFVTCFSPNHRAFLDVGSYDLTSVRVGPDGEATSTAVEPPQPGPASAPSAEPEPSTRLLSVTADLSWEYGAEANVTTGLRPGGARRRGNPGFVVDQSKQMLGIDKGPNPQELLLSAISATLTMDLARLARERDLPVAAVEVEATGRLDIRGMLNVANSPARFHALRFLVRAETPLDGAALAGLVAECAAGNPFLTMLRVPNVVDVDLRSPAEALLEFRSDAGQVAAFLAEVARIQAEQAATNALTMAAK
jgi:uncharacterized OsmC-like protein